MKKLILMRHAKSGWDDPTLDDHDRPLNQRGRLAATLMGAFLRDANLTPDAALISSAARTQETWARMTLDRPSVVKPDLYLAGPLAIIGAVQAADDNAQSVLVLGHQPGMEDAANRFCADSSLDGYPTAKITVIGFDVDQWANVTFGSGRLIREAAPKSLV
ncbi:MAG: SixA phosphatase family protein [Pikeienuella sp.]